MEQTPAEIAAMLNDAQRDLLKSPRETSWSEAEQQKLPSQLFGEKWCGFAHLNTLGLAVRAELQKAPKP